MRRLLSSEEKEELKKAVASVRHEIRTEEYELGKVSLAQALRTQYEALRVDGKELLHGYRITTPRRGKAERNSTGKFILDNTGRKIYDKGYRKSHTVMNLDLWKLLFQKKVCRLESLGAENSLLFIDFDYIPECFCTSSWDTVYELMQARVRNDGFVFRSASGKVKVMHIIKGLLEGGPAKFKYFNIAKDMYPDLIEAKAIVGFTDDKPVYKFCIDRLGFEHTYLDHDTLELLSLNFAHKKILNYNNNIIYTVNTIVEQKIKVIKSNPFDDWNLYNKELPFDYGNEIKQKQFIFRILAGSFYASVGKGIGLGLSSSFLAEKLECSREYISRLLREMIRDGVIRKTSSHFMGVVAARYKFIGKFLKWGIMEQGKIKKENKLANKNKKENKNKKAVEDSGQSLFQRRISAASRMVPGNIDTECWAVAKENLFKDRQELQEWAYNIPAMIEQPKRLKKLLRAWDKQQRWQKEREECNKGSRERVAA